MKPRVFVSSTYYDLRHIRDNLEIFVEQYGFDPVLFESGKVTFDHDQPLDESCFEEVKLCHMMILIIGGRYGSPTSDQNLEEHINKYEQEYMSITRKEFRTAKEKGIPIFVFIDKNVDAEYQTFKKNENFFLGLIKDQSNKKNNTEKFRFAHVDSHNIFNFINEVRIGAIQTFESFEDIEQYLRNQWSGMFYTYLDDLRSKKKKEEVLDSVNEIKLATERMNDILQAVGQKVFDKEEDRPKFEKILREQNEKLVKFFASKTLTKISHEEYPVCSGKEKEIATIFYRDFLENKDLFDLYQKYKNKVEWNIKKKYTSDATNKINKSISDIGQAGKVVVSHIEYSIIPLYYQEIKPLFEKDPSLIDTLINEMKNEMEAEWLPF